MVGMTVILGTTFGGICYYCNRRKQLAITRLARQMAADMGIQNQQRAVYYMDLNTNINTEIPLQEAPPLTYEQVRNGRIHK